jgi:hypothetical protein
MHDSPDLELGFAEQVMIFFANQQPRQGQQFVVRLRAQFGQQFLSLRLEFRGKCLLKRHEVLLARGQ